VGIWTDPEGFKQRIYEISEATKSLILAAKSKDILR
jgi:hypothetical protein